MRKLSNLSIGESSTIKQIEGDCLTTKRLMTMSVLPGIDVKVLSIAPLGDPIMFEFNSNDRISLRKKDLDSIFVL